jgi:hypothetical protein
MLRLGDRPDDGGNKHLLNVSKFIRDYVGTTSQKVVTYYLRICLDLASSKTEKISLYVCTLLTSWFQKAVLSKYEESHRIAV